MSTMLYREGRGTRVWGKEYETKIVADEEVSKHLKEGWSEHPDDVKASSTNQRGRKPKAGSDESDD
ncbi:hypothetical protein QBD22_003814 [Cronobacter muytjensii]|nr:hypothetical protein [Cronobacter muytjensii]